ncbi:MAG: segregation/condensation protein A [Clostridia bacterium]|nr:segregation/condensation protein A [Clostridia bacterium]
MSDYEKLFAEEMFEEDEDAYRFRLNDFEGPLDTLLFLIRKSKVSIEDVKISEITEQYLEFMKEIETVDLDKASEFITMAALLLEIKSKSLLPKPPEPEPTAEDEEKALKQQLKLYALYKEAAVKMKENETEDIFYRQPDPSVGMPRLQLKDMNKSGLMDALKRMFVKLEERVALQKERHIVMDRFTVAEMVGIIKEKLEYVNKLSFFNLFDDDYTKSEVITTFQALLELIKNQVVIATQDSLFDDIILHKAG